jgi:hypothetical protein
VLLTASREKGVGLSVAVSSAVESPRPKIGIGSASAAGRRQKMGSKESIWVE